MIDTLFLPRRVHVPFAKCPLYSRAIGVQKMCNLEFSTEGTRCSKQVSCSRRSARWDEFLISLSLFLFPSFISELITRTLVNRVCSRWPQKCSRTHHLRRSELGSRFVVHWRGGVAAQSSVSYLSLSLFVFVVPAVRRISMWVNSVLDYARARMHDFQNEVSGGAHRTRRDTVSVLLQTKSKSLREGGGNCPRTIRGRWKFGIWDENRIRKKRIGWE